MRAAAALAAALAWTVPGTCLAQADPRPDGLVALPDEPGQRAVLVEKSTQSLGVWESGPGGPRLVKMLPCTTGRADGDKLIEGDLRTPEGVYWFTRYIPGYELPPLYGAGALVMDYPNVFDVRDGKTGSGIWLHGVEEDSRVLVSRDTRGCVAVRNDHFEELRRILGLRDTPILVVQDVRLAPARELEAQAEVVRRQLEDWREAWERGDLARYAGHYAPDFASDGLDLEGWIERKDTLASRHGAPRVAFDSLLVLRDGDRLWVGFRQEYVSASHRDVGRKVLALRRDGPAAPWRIASERWRPLAAQFELLDLERAPVPVPVARLERPAPPPPPVEPAPVAPAEELPPPEPAPAPPPGPAVAPAAAPVTPAARPAATARLEPASSDRGTFALLGPYARVAGGRAILEVQLMSRRPEFSQDGEVLLVAALPGGETVSHPAGAVASGAKGERFQVKQGLLLTLELPLPSQASTVPVTVHVRDDRGTEALRQVVTLELPGR